MAVKIFFCYAREDEPLLNELKAHLRPLQYQGLIDVWHDREISAGTEWEQEIHQHLNEAQIILLLISPAFMNSDYCYGVEMKRAIEKHNRHEAQVIPIILRHVYWQGVLGNLQALPRDARPVKSWPDQDEAFYSVTEGIRKALEKIAINQRSPRSSPIVDNPIPKQPAYPPQRSAPNQSFATANAPALKQQQPVGQKQVLLSSAENSLSLQRRKLYSFSVLIGGGVGVLNDGLSTIILFIHFSYLGETLLSTAILIVAGYIAGYIVGRIFPRVVGTIIGGLLAGAIVGILFLVGAFLVRFLFGLSNIYLIIFIVGTLCCAWFGGVGASGAVRRYRYHSKPII